MGSQSYAAQGGLSSTITDAANVRPELIRWLVLSNYMPNRRVGGIKKRGGSTTETISGTLNKPLGMGVYKVPTTSSLLPFEIVFLANFAGANWRKYDTGVWSSVSTNANVSFSTTKPGQSTQLGNTMVIAGGRPARWDDGASEIERLGYPAPGSAITYTTSAGSLSPATGYTWIFTYYNSTTGKESDWSPISAASGAQVSKQFDLTITTAAAGSSADKKRIYRTTDGGSTYYYVTQIDIATGTYTDNTADTALGAEAPFEGVHGMPPDESFIVENYASRVWLNNTSDAYALHPSQPFTGNDNDVEYFDEEDVIRANHEITGVKAANSRMYLFGTRKISFLTGASDRTFTINDFREGVGTLHPNSIASNGEDIIFLSEDGVKSIKNGTVTHISGDIDEDLRRILQGEYNVHTYVSATWNPAHGMFFLCISASEASGTPWVLSSTSTQANWILSGVGADAPWELTSGSAAENSISRNKLWGYDPRLEVWASFEFSQAPDFNDGRKAITFLASPPTNSAVSDLRQEKTYIGIDGGTNAGIIVSGFREDVTQDDNANVPAKAISQRLQPGAPNTTKRYRFLEVEGEYSDPESWGATLQYILDGDDPQFTDYSTKLYDFANSGDKKTFDVGLGKHIHLVIEDETAVSGGAPLQSFKIHYLERKQRESR